MSKTAPDTLRTFRFSLRSLLALTFAVAGGFAVIHWLGASGWRAAGPVVCLLWLVFTAGERSSRGIASGALIGIGLSLPVVLTLNHDDFKPWVVWIFHAAAAGGGLHAMWLKSKATGIVILVVVLGSLVSWFTLGP